MQDSSNVITQQVVSHNSNDLKMVLYIGLIIVFICVVVIVTNSLHEYRRTVYLSKNMTGLMLMSIIAPIFNDYAKKSIDKVRHDDDISSTELSMLVDKIYDTVQMLTTINPEQKKLLTKETIRILVTPYYEQLVNQIISIEKYYSQKNNEKKKEGN